MSDAEMGMTAERVLAFLRGTREYAVAFTAAFPAERDPVTLDNLAKALATFERGIVSAQAPFDAWIAGDEAAISETAKRGFMLFNGKAKCAACHSGWRFSDGSFHDTGLDDPDEGRGKFLSGMVVMQNAFKTVGLRNIARRAPFMHNGSLKTLGDVVDFYNDRFVRRESLSDEIKPLNLTSDEKADLLAFLDTLTSDDPPVAIPNLPR